MRLVGDRETELSGAFRELPRPEKEKAEVEADDGGLRKLACERAEAPEGLDWIALRERSDGGRGADGRVVRSELRGRVELALGRAPPPQPPQREPVAE